MINYAIKNNKGQYIKYGTAFNNKMDYTNTVYDAHTWKYKELPQRLINWLSKNKGLNNLTLTIV